MKKNSLLLLSIGIVLISAANFWIPDAFTRAYVCIQIVVGLLAFGILRWKKGWYTHTNTAASILTIIGVLGTFIGIFIGLQAFQIENIEGSIQDLLDGLKLAFLTSLVGISWAIILKTFAFAYQMIKDQDPNEETINRFVDQLTTTLTNVQTSGDINLLAQLVALNTTIEEKGSETREALENIKTDLVGIHSSLTEEEGATLKKLHTLTTTVSNKHNQLISAHAIAVRETHEMLTAMKTNVTSIRAALTGEDESTVFAQLKELTSTVSEKVGEIAAKVGEIATGQLIEALREVIRDFNKNLTEQFGENFKQLNEAVGRTVEWQGQYRQQMDELAEEFRIAAQSIEQSRTALASITQSLMTIEDQSESLVSIAEKLDPILHTLNNQLEAFSELRQKAHDAFPLIENRLNDLTTGFSDTVKAAITDSHNSVENQRASLATHTEQLEKSSNETTQRITELTTNFSDTIKISIAESQNSMNQQREALNVQLQQLQTSMIDSNQKIQQTISDTADHLDHVFERSADHIVQVTSGFTQNLSQQLQNMLESQAHELSNIVERNKDDIENHVNTLHSALRKEVNTLNESLREELGDSLQTLAGHLESLSNGFVKNYSELVVPYTQVLTSLQQLVDASRQGLR